METCRDKCISGSLCEHSGCCVNNLTTCPDCSCRSGGCSSVAANGCGNQSPNELKLDSTAFGNAKICKQMFGLSDKFITGLVNNGIIRRKKTGEGSSNDTLYNLADLYEWMTT